MLCIFHPKFPLRVEGSSINVSKWCVINPVKSKWCMSLDLLVCAICVCIFKGERVNVHKWLSVLQQTICSYHVPCILGVSKDPDAGTALDWNCCFCQLSICVGSHLVCRWWFSQGLTKGCPALPSYLLMSAASTLSSTRVYHIEPDCKGWHTNLAGCHQKK